MTPPQLAGNARGRVLVVDDDAAVRFSVEGVLGLEFDVQGAASVDEALMRLQQADFDVVLSDYRMPGRSGLDLLRTVTERYPDVMVILLTGHPDLTELQNPANVQAVVRVLSKPYDPKRLLHWVSSTVKLSRMRRLTNAIGRMRAPRAS